MTLEEIEPYLQQGKLGKLPNYEGYFKYDFAVNKIYMQNKDYKKYDLKDEMLRTDFYYII